MFEWFRWVRGCLTIMLSMVAMCGMAAQRNLVSEGSMTRGDRNLRKPGKSMDGTMKLDGRYISANRQTGEMLATGHVTAVSGVYRFKSEKITRDVKGLFDFGYNVCMTTCTNEIDHLHWRISDIPPAPWLPRGNFKFASVTNDTTEHKALTVKNVWLYWQDYPVCWIPYWYYPMDTNYGWRFMPGYSSRWGGYFLSGYVYDIVNEGDPSKYGLGGSSYADYRTKNGFALGQTIRWHLKDFGEGKIRGYYAWDDDYDRYTHHWNDHKHNYQNWGSDVERERYRVYIQHKADFTERDSFRLQANYLSDSHMLRDFFDRDHRDESFPVNQMWYEHRENSFAGGAQISGPVNDFYGGTQRLPEGFFAIEPQPLWDFPVNYESWTRAGYLNRDYARYGSDNKEYRYNPYIGVTGRGADYQAFRADTEHRISWPMKFADVLSFVPRASYRATYWSDSGDEDSSYCTASGDAMSRHIAEFGFTLSARGSTWLSPTYKHTVEPYLDYSFQRVNLTSGDHNRYYVFDNLDRSVDWLDQFGFEGRGLPFDWHGIRPGVRNYFQRTDERGILRRVADIDIYAAIPFEDESVYTDGPLKGYAKEPEKGNYASTDYVVPGLRLKLSPTRDFTFGTRAEYDIENEKVAYADVSMRHDVTDNFSWYLSYIGRDHRIWDYLPSERDRWNYELNNILGLGFTHNVCYWFSWSPFIRYDCRRNETERVGAWFDFLTDCLGYRIEVEHEDSYTRSDGSKYDADDRATFYIYLRALGPSSTLDLVKF